MEHFVKQISAWNDDTRQVDTYTIDSDVAHGDNQDCANAIGYSLKKMGVHGNEQDAFKLKGFSADSGGAGTKEGLGDLLVEAKLTDDWFVIITCAIHCLQLQLSNSVKKMLGDGGLFVQNMMQLGHSAYDLQEACPDGEWVLLQDLASKYLKRLDKNMEGDIPSLAKLASDANANLKKGQKPFTEDTVEDPHHFQRKMNVILTFKKFTMDVEALWPLEVDEDGNETQSYKKIPPMILTRWQYVGDVTCVVWRAYLLLFRMGQMVLNTHRMNRAGKIAAGMMSLMTEPEIFSDLCLVKCYHEGYFTRQMSWLMKCRDMTKPGHQTHHMPGFFYQMRKQLQEYRDANNGLHHAHFFDFRKTLDISGVDKTVQIEKLKGFIDISIEKCEEHFARWIDHKHLPAALLSETLLAKSVARVMLRKEPLQNRPVKYTYSKIHPRPNDKFIFDDYESFLDKWFVKSLNLEDGQQPNLATLFPPQVLAAAELLVTLEVDILNNVIPENPLRVHNLPQTTALQVYMWRNYLPAASHTQMVERGVKKIGVAGKTGRSEEHRSAYVIYQSYVTDNDNLSELYGCNMSKHLMESAQKFWDEIEAIRHSPGYKEQYDEVYNLLLPKNHYKSVRIIKTEEKVFAKCDVEKKEVKAQKSKGVHRTNAVMKTTPYSKVQKGKKGKSHIEDVRLELSARGCPQDLIDDFVNKKWSDMKDWLKKNEQARVLALGGNVKEAEKAFTPQSEAKFLELK